MTRYQIIQGIELVKALYTARIDAKQPASKLWAILLNLQDNFTQGNYFVCDSLLLEASKL